MNTPQYWMWLTLCENTASRCKPVASSGLSCRNSDLFNSRGKMTVVLNVVETLPISICPSFLRKKKSWFSGWSIVTQLKEI